jgi:hypothetical protein
MDLNSPEVVGILLELAQLYDDLQRRSDAAKTFSEAWRRYLEAGDHNRSVGAALRTGLEYEKAGNMKDAEVAYSVCFHSFVYSCRDRWSNM